MLNVEKSLNHEVLSLVDKTLPSFLNFVTRQIGALAELYVLASRDLSFFLNLFALDFVTHFVAICKSVILPNFTKDVCLAHLSSYERLFELEAFFFDAFLHIDFDVGLIVGKQVLSCEVCRLWHPDKR